MHRRWLVFVGMGLVCGRALAGGLPDYPSESDLLVDTPGTVRSVAGGLFNPAAWPMQRGGGLLLGWNDERGDLSRGDLTGVVSTQYMGFAARQFRYEPVPGDAFRVRDYVFGLGAGNRIGSLGASYGWGGGALDRVARHERVAFGGVARSRWSSLGLAWTRDLEVDDNNLQSDLGLRPFGPRLTFFGDAVYGHGQSFADIRSGYGVEVRPTLGLAFAAKARSTGEVSLRVNLALGRHTEVGYRPHLDDAGDRSAQTYTVELGPDRAPIGYGTRRGSKFPTFDMRGRMGYQRYKLFDRRHTLLNTLRSIQAAADDRSVGGVVVNLSGAEIGLEMYWELREQFAGLRARGKKVIVYVDRAGMGAYMLASVADAIWMDPVGQLDLRGLATGRTFMRHAIDKAGLGVDEWRFFTYKSAFETYSRDSMSDPDREQRQALIDDFYEEIAAAVTTARGITRAQWDAIVNEQGFLLAPDARIAGLVDTIGTLEQAQQSARRIAPRQRPDASAAVLSGVTGEAIWSPLEWGQPARIAVLYAIGPCEMETGIRGRVLSQAIRAAGRDPFVKAIVLRADSPGGDPLPSDLVARAMRDVAKKKPVIVSQGQVAGSGGYWISMYGDTIVASPMTVTGSIGVIGGWIWNKELGTKIGFDYDGVKHGRSADLEQGIRLPLIDEVVPDRALTSEERDRIEIIFRAGYKEFVGKVAQGRGLEEKYVDSIGQGHAWSGTRGSKNGLVDELGGLWRSLQIAKSAAKLPESRAIEFVEAPEPSLLDISALKPKLFGVSKDVYDQTVEEHALPLRDPEIDFLRAIVRAHGRPIVRMEPIEIEDGGPASQSPE